MTQNEWTNGFELGIDILNNKYMNENETLDEFFDRISGGDSELRQQIERRKFIFGGRILANRGNNLGNKRAVFSNCFVIEPPEDNIESIFDCAKRMARTFSVGGGVGTDLSKLSPKNARINNAAKHTSGAVSFMELYSMVTGLISQGSRRGALMLSMDCSHPDIEDFIDIKNDLDKVTKANISVRLSYDFIDAVKNNKDWELKFTRGETGEVISKKVNAKKLMQKLANSNWTMAEPGILNWDRITEWNLLSNHPEFEYAGVNPCVSADTQILTSKGNIPITQKLGKNVSVWNGTRFSTVVPKITGTDETLYRVHLSNHDHIDCTDYHVFILSNGRRFQLKDLNIGDALIDHKYPVIELGQEVDDKTAYTQGFFHLNGDKTPHKSRRYVKLRKTRTHLLPFLDYTKSVYCPSFEGLYVTLQNKRRLFNREFVPTIKYSARARQMWLAGYLDACGKVNKKSGSVYTKSRDRLFLERVKSMLNTIGGTAMITESKQSAKIKAKTPWYNLIINRTNVTKLIEAGLETKHIPLVIADIQKNPQLVKITNIEKLDGKHTVYCFNEKYKHSATFNGILTGQCGKVFASL